MGKRNEEEDGISMLRKLLGSNGKSVKVIGGDDPDMNDILSSMVDGIKDKHNKRQCEITPAKQRRALKEFIEYGEQDFKVGDYVERNEFGEERYKFPIKDQIGLITRVYPKGSIVLDKEGQHVDFEMVVVQKDGDTIMPMTYGVDGRYFRKLTDEEQE